MFPPPPPFVPAPPPPLPAHPPLYRDPQDALSRREAEALVDSLVAKKIAAMAAAGLIPVKQGDPGDPGPRGVTFTPHVSSAGVLSWTNDGGLANPEPVVIKGIKGDPGSDGTVNAQTLASVNAALADFQNAYSQLSAAVVAAQNAATAAATARTDATAAAAAISTLAGMQTLPARVAALELDYGNYLNQIRSPNALTKVKAKNDGTAVVERIELGRMRIEIPAIVVEFDATQYGGSQGIYYVNETPRTVYLKGPYQHDLGEGDIVTFYISDVYDTFAEFEDELYGSHSGTHGPSTFDFIAMRPGRVSVNVHAIDDLFEPIDLNSASLTLRVRADSAYSITGGSVKFARAWKATQYPITVGSTPVASSQSNDWTD